MQTWLRAEAQGADEKRHLLAHELGVPFVTFERHEVDPEALLMIPEPLARAHSLVAYRQSEQGLEVAVLALESLAVLEPLRARLPKILPRLANEASVRAGLVRYQQLLKERFGQALAQVRHPAQLLRGLISHALASGAAAVHLEPAEAALRVRYRVGGHLYDALVLPHEAHRAISAALPASASGMLELGHADAVHLRVHTAPCAYGSKIVLHPSRAGRSLESLGLHGDALDRVYRTLARERGMVLAVGYGTSTLLESLRESLARGHLSVVAVGDAAALRAALRADADAVVMDGVPDRESGRLLAEAARRGVLVLASAPGDIAAEMSPDLLIKCAVVRRLCTKQFHNTKKLSRQEGEVFERYTAFAPVFNALKEEGKIKEGTAWKDVAFAHPVPCRECSHGYSGAVGIYEVEDREGVVGLTLAEDGLFKAAEGLTSIEEILGLLQPRQEMA